VERFLRLADIYPRLFEHRDAAREIFSTDHAFRRFVDVLIKRSAEFDGEEVKDDVDPAFKQVSSQPVISSKGLDESWLVRDISRAYTTTRAWRLRILGRLRRKYFGEMEFYSWLLRTIRVSPLSFLLLFSHQHSATIEEGSEFAIEILRTFKTQIASAYEWGGNDITVNTAMALVDRFLPLIFTDSEPELSILIVQLYRWIVKVVINRDLSSPNARVEVLRFLQKVSLNNVVFADGKVEPNPGLLQINLLQDVDIRVQFQGATIIATAFLQFPLADRVTMYREIVDRLETDEMNLEAFAVRAYTLTRLALASDDIRRAAMVNLLELGKFETCKQRVQECFGYISRTLYHDDISSLWIQNCSQFIHSWIDFEENIFQFPYYVFGFSNFRDWSESVRSELISQLINAERWHDALNVFKDAAGFENIMALCLPQIVTDFRLIEAESPTISRQLLERCEATLGRTTFYSILMSNFALSLAIMVERLDDRTLNESALDSLGFGTSASLLRDMQLPELSLTYPDPPQPAFSLQSVVFAIKAHQQFLAIPPQDVWSPANVMFILRRLVNHAKRSSDNTLTISYLRRLAFVLCLPHAALSELYILEMLLLSIPDFVSDVAVCKEAMCIVKFVYSVGENHITTNPNLFRRAILALLAAIQKFWRSGTSQEMQSFISDTVQWLRSFMQFARKDRNLHAVYSLLEAFTKQPMKEPVSAGNIMRKLIDEDQTIWKDPSHLTFALQFLSAAGPVELEAPSTLKELVHYFLHVDGQFDIDADSKVWFGCAIGLVSREARIQLPEYIPTYPTMFEHFDSTIDNPRNVAFLQGIITFSQSHVRIAETLEHAIRNITSTVAIFEGSTTSPLQSVFRSLCSPHITATSPSSGLFDYPPLSDLAAWRTLNVSFADWHKYLACATAQDIDNDLYRALVGAIYLSEEFREAVFPLLVHEHQTQKSSSDSLTAIFNFVLASVNDLDYWRTIIRVILFLRERPIRPLLGKSSLIVDNINYFQAAKTAIACEMFKTALLFLELHVNSDNQSLNEVVIQILSQIYRHVEDPDLSYSLSKGIDRSWPHLVDIYELHHDREGINDLRRARLRGKMELEGNIAPGDEDLGAVAEFIRKDGFPLQITQTGRVSDIGSSAEISLNGVYGSAWRLGLWDLPPLAASNDYDTLLYAVTHQLRQNGPSNRFFRLLDISIIRSLDRFQEKQAPNQTIRAITALSLFASFKGLFSGQRSMAELGYAWGQKIVKKARFER